jgi:acyl dehydratase
MDLLHFEDFQVGEVLEFGDRLVDADEIVEFARQFDPQPFHLDDAAARGTQAGGLIASGWQTASILMRMCCDEFVLRSASQGGPGVEELNWVKPVRPGDRLRARRTTTSARPSASRPELGLVGFQFQMFNQHGETVMTQKNVMMIRRRATAEVAR